MFFESWLFSQTFALADTWADTLGEIIHRRLTEGVRLTKEEVEAMSYQVDLLQYAEIDIAPETGVYADGAIAFSTVGEDTVTVNGHGDPAKGQKVAVVNVMGGITQRPMGVSGPQSASCEAIGNAVDAVMADSMVKAMILRVDSPGGTTIGVNELRDKIASYTGVKPIVAVCDGLMCSAAYWLASAADEIVITPSGLAGNIGVYTMHKDVSEAMKAKGIAATIVSRGKYKTEGNHLGPLEGEAKAALQKHVDAVYDQFVTDVAKGRSTADKKITAADVENGFGQGRALNAKNAVKEGVADRIGTFEATLKRMGSRAGTVKPRMGVKAETFNRITAASDFLPLASADALADAGPVLITVGDDKKITATAEKTTTVFSAALFGEGQADYLTLGAGKIVIATSAGEHIWAITAVTETGDFLATEVSRPKVKAADPVSEPVKVEQTEEEKAAYRRRSHAHMMMRSARSPRV